MDDDVNDDISMQFAFVAKFFPQMHTDHTHTATKSALPFQIRILVAGVCCWTILNLFCNAIFDFTHVAYSWEYYLLML